MLGATVLLHLLMWRALTAPVPPKATPPKPVRVSVLRVVPPAAAVPAPAPVPSANTPLAAPARERPQRGRAPGVPEARPGVAPTAPAVAEPGPPDASVAGAAASAPAAAPGAAPGLLDSAATRRAIRETARQRPMSDLGDDPARPDRQLSDAMAGAAKGDCLKGEYAGAGMGLLSLPFWALAKLRDQCSK